MGRVRRPSPRTPYTCDRIRNTSTTHFLEAPLWEGDGALLVPWLSTSQGLLTPCIRYLNHPAHPHSRLLIPMEALPQLTYTGRRLHYNCCSALGIFCVPLLVPRSPDAYPPWCRIGALLFFFGLARLVWAFGCDLLSRGNTPQPRLWWYCAISALCKDRLLVLVQRSLSKTSVNYW